MESRDIAQVVNGFVGVQPRIEEVGGVVQGLLVFQKLVCDRPDVSSGLMSLVHEHLMHLLARSRSTGHRGKGLAVPAESNENRGSDMRVLICQETRLIHVLLKRQVRNSLGASQSLGLMQHCQLPRKDVERKHGLHAGRAFRFRHKGRKNRTSWDTRVDVLRCQSSEFLLGKKLLPIDREVVTDHVLQEDKKQLRSRGDHFLKHMVEFLLLPLPESFIYLNHIA